MLTWRRIVFVAQWFAAALLPVWWFVQPGAFNPGWAAVLMLFVAPILLVLLIVSSLVAVLARPGKPVAAVSGGYAIAAPLSWLFAFLLPLAMEGASDARSYPSAFELLGMPSAVAGALAGVFGILFLLGWIASLALCAVPRAAAGTAPAVAVSHSA